MPPKKVDKIAILFSNCRFFSQKLLSKRQKLGNCVQNFCKFFLVKISELLKKDKEIIKKVLEKFGQNVEK